MSDIIKENKGVSMKSWLNKNSTLLFKSGDSGFYGPIDSVYII